MLGMKFRGEIVDRMGKARPEAREIERIHRDEAFFTRGRGGCERGLR